MCKFFIDNSEKFALDNLENDDFVLSTACCKIVNIGEETGRLSDKIVEETAQQVDWHKVRGMRNRLAHEYLEVDIDIVYRTTTDYIPQLLQELQILLDS